ncbi:MAG: PAS domain-containing protein, partial [Deltaproteobacteria bacterium]|nr:PAS domain-containing protein [Deltaproteobacteria bacterium]
ETAQTLPLLGLRVGDETIVCDVHVIHLFEEAVANARTILLFVDQSAKMALRESEHNLRSLADSSTGLIWAADTDKLYYYFNKGWLNFTGSTLDEQQGHGWKQGIHDDDLERCIAIYEQNFDARKAFSMDYRLQRHDGEFRWIRDNGTPRYNTEGQFVG